MVELISRPLRSLEAARRTPATPEGYDDPTVRRLFDAEYYQAQLSAPVGDPLEHYLQTGWRLGRDPHPLFASRFYLDRNLDVAVADACPLVHFVRYGAAEGRAPHPLFDPRFYRGAHEGVADVAVNPLVHFLDVGGRDGMNPNEWFDTDFYLANSPDVAAAGMNALEHYVRAGWRDGRRPHPEFDVAYYLRTNPEVAEQGIEPLTHFLALGLREGRDPSATFDLRFLAIRRTDDTAAIDRRSVPRRHGVGRDDGERPPCRLVVLTGDPDSRDARALLAACPMAHVERPDRYEPRRTDYIYAPDRPDASMSTTQLCNVALCVAHQCYDFLVVSHDLSTGSTVLTPSAANALVLSGEAYLRRLTEQPLRPGSTGRVVRLLPGSDGELATLALDELGLGALLRHGAELVVSGASPSRRSLVARRVPASPVLAKVDPQRPLILTLPAVLAVGGAERNMFEVLRHLRDRYDSVVVTNEPLRAEQGSLHHQAIEVSPLILDLGELAPPDLHIAMLESIRDAVRPDLVWITNGSVWLADNAAEVRGLFRATPIVDQEVYDSQHGWIDHFATNPGLRSFDRYVAGSTSIERALREDHRIAPHRVTFIPHALGDGPDDPRKLENTARREMLTRFALPDDAQLFAFIGRLTEQKAPVDFLEVARRWRDEPAVHFVMVGSGDLSTECAEFVRLHDLRNVTRLEYIEDVNTLYPLLSGLIVSSRYECLPLVVLESLASGVPVLSTDVGDVKLLLEEHGAGQIAIGFGGEALSRALHGFRENLPELTRGAQRGAAAVRERYSGATIADRYDHCFRSARAEFGAVLDRSETDGISVVVPTRDRREQLERTLRACVRFSDCIPMELVVIDDGSTDDTSSFLEAFARELPQLVWRRVPEGGPGAARNVGARLARHDVLLFIGDDTEPLDDRFFRTHLDVHRRHPDVSTAVLGKMVWPNTPDYSTTFVMQQVQGHGGEQFGYADVPAYSTLDWRYFYTCNVSIKRSLVDDWECNGFRREFETAACEDTEFAYRMSQRPEGLRILYAPTSVGAHRHHYTMEGFLERQRTVGRNVQILLDMHPQLGPAMIATEVLAALRTAPTPGSSDHVRDYVAVLDGLMAFGRLTEAHHGLGGAGWHQPVIHALFECAYLEGFVSASPDSSNRGLAYRAVIERFYRRAQMSLQNELLGYSPTFDKLIPYPS